MNARTRRRRPRAIFVRNLVSAAIVLSFAPDLRGMGESEAPPGGYDTSSGGAPGMRR